MLDRTIGQDDLVAVMTPEMSAGAISFARRTGSIEELLGRYWDYAKREQLANLDPEESTYAACYPAESASMYSEMAIEMINRRREKMTLSALEDLIVHLQGLREERKAILTVSEGWALYRPNSNLARAVEGRVPGPPAIGVGPDGRLRSGDLGRSGMGVDLSRCDSDRIALAQDDNDREFRRLLDLANRANASFYPIDPRGLPVFDTTIGLPGSEQNPTLDQARLKYRIETLRTLADATDGIAIVNSNNIDAGLTRVVDDLSSYYLLGYYSSNSKPDGRFRSITVRVKRPGVTVRTRRGYLAPTREEVEARTAASASPAPATPVEVALRGLPRPRLNTFVHSIAGYAWRSATAGEVQPVLWLSGELDASAGSRDEAWKNGGEVSLTVTGADKEVVGEGQYKLSSQNRFFQLRLPESGALAPGDYSIRVTSKPAGATLGSSETVRVHVPSAPSTDAAATPAPASFFRRGPFSGAGWKPVGDMRFRRQERAKMEVAIVGPFDSFTMKLLDRNGNALNVPVAPSERTEEGVRVVAGELTLAPLAAGDYIIEASIDQGGKSQKVLGAFRVIQ
jgi:VWFA-related protein